MKSHILEQSASQAGAQRPVMVLTSGAFGEAADALARARAFAEPLLIGEVLDTGEPVMAHADAVALILRGIGGSQAMQAATYLVYAFNHLNKPMEVITKSFGANFAALAMETTKLVRVQRHALEARTAAQLDPAADPQVAAAQVENVRKMLLAFSRDMRVVMLRLASRLQTLRYYAAQKEVPGKGVALEALQVFAPLASRLGIWEIKWELEDLAFRFLEPETYREVAKQLDQKRTEREASVEQLRADLERDLNQAGIESQVSGRPKHIYSIVKKMRGKSLDFEQVHDLRALRVLVSSVPACYAALSYVHSHFDPVHGEFDDYIAKPKVNGYQSLHTVVRDDQGRSAEIQIRTHAMHDHAENGVAAHWAYKEAGSKGYTGVSASGAYEAKIAVLRQLLAWERDLSGAQNQAAFDDRIYVLTPEASVVELPRGATAVDFAYSVHTDLGHRCRGARVDGAMVSLNTPLQNGQTVEINAAKEGGPSRDWLNPELGYLASHRAKAKVRAWFNAQALSQTIAKGREAVEKLLQREGKTAWKFDDLATELGFSGAEALFEDVGKDEFSLRRIELLINPPAQQADPHALPVLRKSRATKGSGKGGVVVEGVHALMTQLAKCCRPAPPDSIVGFVSRTNGVSVHRADCSNVREMLRRNAQRQIEVAWGINRALDAAVYPVDVMVQANDRQGLLRDISEVFTKEKMNVIGVQTHSDKGLAWMTFTVEVPEADHLYRVLGQVSELAGVRAVRRK